MQAKHLCVLFHIRIKGEVGTKDFFVIFVFVPYSDVCFLQPCGHLCDVFLSFCHFPIQCPGSGVVLECIDS